MAGRPRRASTSSVESVDESQIRWRQETSVLRHVPKDVPPDDWPIFELRDAIVLNRDGQTLENALHVGVRGPFTIRGTLIIDDAAQKTHLIMRAKKETPIEIRQCISYSIGESPDGSPLIWVSGRGGWYEINPSPAYRFTYRKMCEATTLYYNLLDIYSSRRPPKRSKKHKNADPMDELSSIFLQYAARVGDGCTYEEVITRCSEHAGFFISQSQHETLIDWKPTAFYKWLTTEHADLVETIENLLKNPRKLSPVPSIDTLSPRPRDSASVSSVKGSSVERAESKRAASQQIPRSTAAPAKGSSVERAERKRAASRQISGTRAAPHHPVIGEDPADPDIKPISLAQADVPKESAQQVMPQDESAEHGQESPFSLIFSAMEDIHEFLTASKRGLTISGVLNRLYFEYSLPCFRDGSTGSHKIPAREILHYYAEPLLRHLDPAKYQADGFYDFLQQLSTTEFHPVAYKPSDFPVRLMLRQKKPRPSKKDIAPSPAVMVPTATIADLSDAPSDDAPPTSRGKGLKRDGRRAGRKSYLRPASSGRKRAHSQIGSDSESETPGLKNSHYFSDGDDAMEDAPQVETPQDGETSEIGQPTPKGTPIKIVIRAEKIPSSTPKGPDETWTCDQEGCDYIVRGGDEEECQARIRDHFNDHEQQLERVSLAVTESRGHLPINHLLDKIKRMGEKAAANGPQAQMQLQQAAISEMTLTQPIKRKLIV